MSPSISHLLHDYARISDIMRTQGVRTDEASGKAYFTGYPHQTMYDWDQYFEAIIQLYLGWDGTYVKNAVTLFLDNQKEDGFIPRTVPERPPHREGSEHVKPFLAQTALLLYKREHTLSWLSVPYYLKLKKYLTYWLEDRLGERNLSVWESAPHTGMDSHKERAGWWKDAISEGADLNSYLTRECRAFAVIADVLGENSDASHFRGHADRLSRAVRERLWDEEDGFFYDRHAGSGELIRVKSVAGFTPLWAGIATQEQAERLVTDHLLNPQEFWRTCPVSTYAATEPSFREVGPGASWKANCWIPANYFIFQGLRRYGYNDVAKVLAEKSYKLVKQVGDREYYMSEVFEGCGHDPFWGWSHLAYFMPLESALGYDPTRLDVSLNDVARVTVLPSMKAESGEGAS